MVVEICYMIVFFFFKQKTAYDIEVFLVLADVGIRACRVSGFQTCALPLFSWFDINDVSESASLKMSQRSPK